MSEPRRPDFFIVGAPKSGTTAMYEYLRPHPGLWLPERKELRFFGRDLEIRDRRQLTMDEYLEHFRPAPPASLVGTAYVWYLFSNSAGEEIHAFNPGARIVAMLRNPVDMLPALHAEHLSNGNEEIEDFSAALDAEPERRAGRRIPPHAHLPAGLIYTDVPRYASQLERYFERFGRDRVHVILFDDFAASPSSSYRDLLRFLGVDADFRPPAFEVINPSKRLRSERLRHFLARPPELPRRVIRTLVPKRLRRSAYERAKRLNVVTAPRPPLPSQTRERLRAQFVDEVEALSELLGRDLRDWTAPATASTPG